MKNKITVFSLSASKELANDIAEKLGTKVAISDNKIKISFATKEDLNRILEILNIEVE